MRKILESEARTKSRTKNGVEVEAIEERAKGTYAEAGKIEASKVKTAAPNSVNQRHNRRD